LFRIGGIDTTTCGLIVPVLAGVQDAELGEVAVSDA
jgi:hypothetical protein